jgi:hypothetical protein
MRTGEEVAVSYLIISDDIFIAHVLFNDAFSIETIQRWMVE